MADATAIIHPRLPTASDILNEIAVVEVVAMMVTESRNGVSEMMVARNGITQRITPRL